MDWTSTVVTTTGVSGATPSTAVLAVGTLSTTTEVKGATLVSIAAILVSGVTTMTAVVGATSSASESPAV